MYQCLFNHELLIAGTTQSSYQSYRDDISDRQVRGYVAELAGSGVDALMLCPTAWRRNLWHSKVDPHWELEAPAWPEPAIGSDLKYFEKAYYRWRRYMLFGGDPVKLSVEEAGRAGLACFLSYRMNDHHHAEYPDCPTHNAIYRNLHEAQFLPGVSGPLPAGHMGFFDYRDARVRRYYFDILTELAGSYDVDGLELDFMRSPAYFPDGAVEEGLPVMDDFVRSVRAMLDGLEATRGRRLRLCARVPKSPAECLRVGLNVEKWVGRGWVDMLNLSTWYINDLSLDVAGFRARLPGANLYGEMHFIVDDGAFAGFTNNCTRKTGREMYWAMADQYLSQGATGVSLFNFDYTRDHHFGEPRREGDFGCEPPFDVLRGLTDRAALMRRPKHYYFRGAHLDHPDRRTAVARLRLPRDAAADGHVRSLARVCLAHDDRRPDPAVFLDGRPLEEVRWLGELFPPLTTEALPGPRQLHFFEVPLDTLTAGAREFIVVQRGDRVDGVHSFELALYGRDSLLGNR